MNTARIALHVATAFLLASSTLQGCAPQDEEASQGTAESNGGSTVANPGGNPRKGEISATLDAKTVRFVLVVSSQACKCTLEKCQENREYLESILEKHGLGSNLSILDQAGEEDKAASLVKKYGIRFIPSLLVLDAEGEVLHRYDWDIDQREFEEFLARLRAAG